MQHEINQSLVTGKEPLDCGEQLTGPDARLVIRDSFVPSDLRPTLVLNWLNVDLPNGVRSRFYIRILANYLIDYHNNLIKPGNINYNCPLLTDDRYLNQFNTMYNFVRLQMRSDDIDRDLGRILFIHWFELEIHNIFLFISAELNIHKKLIQADGINDKQKIGKMFGNYKVKLKALQFYFIYKYFYKMNHRNMVSWLRLESPFHKGGIGSVFKHHFDTMILDKPRRVDYEVFIDYDFEPHIHDLEIVSNTVPTFIVYFSIHKQKTITQSKRYYYAKGYKRIFDEITLNFQSHMMDLDLPTECLFDDTNYVNYAHLFREGEGQHFFIRPVNRLRYDVSVNSSNLISNTVSTVYSNNDFQSMVLSDVYSLVRKLFQSVDNSQNDLYKGSVNRLSSKNCINIPMILPLFTPVLVYTSELVMYNNFIYRYTMILAYYFSLASDLSLTKEEYSVIYNRIIVPGFDLTNLSLSVVFWEVVIARFNSMKSCVFYICEIWTGTLDFAFTGEAFDLVKKYFENDELKELKVTLDDKHIISFRNQVVNYLLDQSFDERFKEWSDWLIENVSIDSE